MKNWLSIRNESPPAKAQGTALASRADFDRKIAQFRKATGVLESCRIGFVCGKTGQRFETLFERASPAEKFKVAANETMTFSCSAVQSGKAQAQRRIDMDDFSLTKWRCFGCGVEDFIHCGVCGQNICRSCPTWKVGNREYSKCEPGCGSEGSLEPLDAIGTSAGTRRAGMAKAIAGPRGPKLPTGQSAPLLPGRRR